MENGFVIRHCNLKLFAVFKLQSLLYINEILNLNFLLYIIGIY